MKFFKLLMVLCALLAVGTPAHALLINPSVGDPLPSPVNMWTGNETSQSEIDTVISGIIGNSVELWKDELSGSVAGLPLAGSYEMDWLDGTEPTGGTISHVDGNPIVPATAYLLVKDGAQVPAWYLFDLTALTWNGTDDLVLSGFWPEQGGISHVTLYSSNTPVPEPATMLLLGSGLAGLAAFSRKKLFKK